MAKTTTTDKTVHEALSAESWRTIRLALSLAMGTGAIPYREYEAAMTEVMGTSDKRLW